MIKLIIAEPGSDFATLLWSEATTVASSRLVYPEARAAAGVARRTGRIDDDRSLRSIVAQIDRLCAELRVVDIDDPLARAAGDLAERHGLRGYDAVHLASALTIDDPDVIVATWDRNLSAATLACGRVVAPRL